MTWDFALGVLIGALTSAGFWAGRGYERLRLVMADRRENKPPAVVPDVAVPVS